MVGLAFALAGAAKGAGDSIVEAARRQREEALAALKRQQELQDRQAGWDRQDAVTEREWNREDRIDSEERARENERIDRGATALGEVLFSDRTRAHYRPSADALNISMDFNAVEGGGATGTLVVVPDDASPAVRAAAEEYNRRVVTFAQQNGITNYRDRGVVTRSQNGRGVQHTVHTEPFFSDDIAMQEAIKANPGAFAKIYAETFGALPGARIIAPHGEGRDRGAASPIFGDETSFGELMARSYNAAQMRPSDDTLRVLADPNQSPQVREAIAGEVQRRRGLDPDQGQQDLVGEEWFPDGNGNLVMHGRSGGRWLPYTDAAGNPITKPEDRKSGGEPRALSASMSNEIDEWADVNGVPGDVARAFKVETERLLAKNPEMTPTQAFDEAIRTANREPDVVTPGRSGLLGIGAREEEREPGAYDGTFGRRGDGGGGQGERTATPKIPDGMTEQTVLEQARLAIERGADEAQVIGRLVAMGINPERL